MIDPKIDAERRLCQFLLFSNDTVFVRAVFKPEELRQALMPTLEALYRQDPESLPFRQPVDPNLLGIPVSLHKHTNALHIQLKQCLV